MFSEDIEILKINKYLKSDKYYFFIIIYADRHCSKEKIDGYKNNSENSSTTKLSEQIASGSSMSTIPSFKGIENKCNVCRGKDCMKKFFEFLREHAMEIINFKKKNRELLRKK